MSSRRGWKTPYAGPSNSTPKGKGLDPYYGQSSGDPRAGNTNIRVDQRGRDSGNMSSYYKGKGLDPYYGQPSGDSRAGNTNIRVDQRGHDAGNMSSYYKGKGLDPYYGQPSGDSRVGNTNIRVDQCGHDAGNMSSYYNQDGDRKVTMTKSKNQAGGNAVKHWGTQHSTSNAPGQQNVVSTRDMSVSSATGKPTGVVRQTQTADAKRSNGSGNFNVQQFNRGRNAPPPLQHGWLWGGRGGPAHVNLGQHSGEDFGSNVGGRQNQCDIDDDDDDYLEEDDSDELTSDDFNANGSSKSHETGENKEFKSFFERFDRLSFEELNESSTPWRCPACHSGSALYTGLQALMLHAKTKVTNVKLHRELARLLDEEMNQRGTSAIHVAEAFGKFGGLHKTVYDPEIVWPPIIVVMNTQLEKNVHNGKWLGMGNPDLLDHFRSYEAVKARHSYGPEGHRGMSLLIFESSAMGYLEADRLDKHFADQGIHRSAWEKSNKVLFLHGGKRQLYGYMACRADLDYFNRHTQGHSIVKYDMRSYQEMVVAPLKRMNEDNQQLINFKNKYFEEQKCVEVLKKSVALLLEKTIEENHNIDFLEGLSKEYTNLFQEVLEQKEREDFKALSLEGEKVKQSNADSGTWEDAELSSMQEEKNLKAA